MTSVPATLIPGSTWSKTASTVYRLDTGAKMRCWLYHPKTDNDSWCISYSGPNASEEFPRDTFANILEAMRYAETALLFKNT